GVGHWPCSALGMAWRLASVSIMLGKIALTLIRYGLSSSARLWVRTSSAALEAAYADSPASPFRLDRDATWMIRPRFCLIICGTPALAQRETDLRFRFSMRS